MKKSIVFTAALSASMIWMACTKDVAQPAGGRVPVLPSTMSAYNELPDGAGVFSVSPFGQMPVDNAKATLGRVLFYEKQLSVNNTRSCGSCHAQSRAFADRGTFSFGFNDGLTSRNTPAICNAGTQQAYFWDLRESNLQNMVTQPVANHVEMGLEEPEYMVAKVKALPYYEDLFTQAFGDAEVTHGRIGDALSHFVRSVVSVSSAYDRFVFQGAALTPQEQLGMQLFFTDLPCGQCHGGEHLNGWGSNAQNIGLDTDYADGGMPGTHWETGEPMDGWFKVPSLRNVALTAPYMHDGRFATLEEVVDFYDQGIQAHSQLSFSLREGWNGPFFDFTGGGAPLRMNLSAYEKEALVAFLHTLTDEVMPTDPKFSDPFVQLQH